MSSKKGKLYNRLKQGTIKKIIDLKAEKTLPIKSFKAPYDNLHEHPIAQLISQFNDITTKVSQSNVILTSNVKSLLILTRSCISKTDESKVALNEVLYYLVELYQMVKDVKGYSMRDGEKYKEAYIALFFAIQSLSQVDSRWGRLVADLEEPETTFNLDANLLPDELL